MLTLEVGYDAVGSGTVYQVALGWWAWEPWAHRLGPWRKPWSDFHAGYPQIGDKRGLGISVINSRGRLPRWTSA